MFPIQMNMYAVHCARPKLMKLHQFFIFHIFHCHLAGIQQRLNHLKALSVKSVWIDNVIQGADQMGPRPAIGTLADFKNLTKLFKKQGRPRSAISLVKKIVASLHRTLWSMFFVRVEHQWLSTDVRAVKSLLDVL